VCTGQGQLGLRTGHPDVGQRDERVHRRRVENAVLAQVPCGLELLDVPRGVVEVVAGGVDRRAVDAQEVLETTDTVGTRFAITHRHAALAVLTIRLRVIRR
jgi:hypothetical protein